MSNNTGTAIQWIQFIVTIIGFITLLIKIGVKQGQQEEKNKRFEEQGGEIKAIKEDISDIKEDIAFIKGKLL